MFFLSVAVGDDRQTYEKYVYSFGLLHAHLYSFALTMYWIKLGAGLHSDTFPFPEELHVQYL